MQFDVCIWHLQLLLSTDEVISSNKFRMDCTLDLTSLIPSRISEYCRNKILKVKAAHFVIPSLMTKGDKHLCKHLSLPHPALVRSADRLM